MRPARRGPGMDGSAFREGGGRWRPKRRDGFVDRNIRAPGMTREMEEA